MFEMRHLAREQITPGVLEKLKEWRGEDDEKSEEYWREYIIIDDINDDDDRPETRIRATASTASHLRNNQPILELMYDESGKPFEPLRPVNPKPFRPEKESADIRQPTMLAFDSSGRQIRVPYIDLTEPSSADATSFDTLQRQSPPARWYRDYPGDPQLYVDPRRSLHPDVAVPSIERSQTRPDLRAGHHQRRDHLNPLAQHITQADLASLRPEANPALQYLSRVQNSGRITKKGTRTRS